MVTSALLLALSVGPALPARLSGVVVDRAGNPIAGAAVLAQGWPGRAAASTDAEGRFSLAPPLGGPAWLFVHKDGYRFHGQPLTGGTVTLTRRSEKPAAVLTTLPPALPLEKRQALARAAASPEIEAGLKSRIEPERAFYLKHLARLDPARALEELGRMPLSRDWDGTVRVEVARSLLAEDVEEAQAAAQSADSPMARAIFHVHLHDHYPPARRAVRRKALDEARTALRGEANVDPSLVWKARIARRYLKLGDREQAAKLFAECQATARKLPLVGLGGSALGAFAVELGRFDRRAAMTILEGLGGSERFHYSASLFLALAPSDPHRAEMVLQSMRRKWPRAPVPWLAEACAAMAVRHLPRARRLAELARGPEERAWALAAMAEKLAKPSPREALRLLDEAFDLLSREAETERFHALAPAALMLLPIAEAIDPGLVPELMWRSLSFYPPARTKPPESFRTEATTPAVLAAVLARYDRDLARRYLRHAEMLHPRDRIVLLATCWVDPERGADLVKTLGADGLSAARILRGAHDHVAIALQPYLQTGLRRQRDD
jgi:tetratricopeptide (TPR) repeat protein